jgi:hypothetical protein
MYPRLPSREESVDLTTIVFVLASLYPSNLATNLDNRDGVELVNHLRFLGDKLIFAHPKNDLIPHGKGRVRNVGKHIYLSGYHTSFSEKRIRDIAPCSITFFPRRANELIVLTVVIFV